MSNSNSNYARKYNKIPSQLPFQEHMWSWAVLTKLYFFIASANLLTVLRSNQVSFPKDSYQNNLAWDMTKHQNFLKAIKKAPHNMKVKEKKAKFWPLFFFFFNSINLGREKKIQIWLNTFTVSYAAQHGNGRVWGTGSPKDSFFSNLLRC